MVNEYDESPPPEQGDGKGSQRETEIRARETASKVGASRRRGEILLQFVKKKGKGRRQGDVVERASSRSVAGSSEARAGKSRASRTISRRKRRRRKLAVLTRGGEYSTRGGGRIA